MLQNPLSAAPKLYTSPGPSSIGAAILERCTALKQPFTPTAWAINGHAQSAMGGAWFSFWGGGRGVVFGLLSCQSWEIVAIDARSSKTP